MTYVVIFKKTIVQNEDSENGCFFTALFHGCGSIQKYSVNRINDFMDIFNFGVEENVFGIHFILPFQDTSKGKGIGLRSGNLGRYKLGSKKRMKFYKFEMKNNIPYRLISIDEYEIGEFNFNIASFYYEPSEGSRRSKNYLSLVASLAVTCRNRYEYVLIEFDDAIQGCSFVNGKPTYPVEIGLGIYYGFRFGINFVEMADFGAGFFGFDFMNDDYDSKNGN